MGSIDSEHFAAWRDGFDRARREDREMREKAVQEKIAELIQLGIISEELHDSTT